MLYNVFDPVIENNGEHVMEMNWPESVRQREVLRLVQHLALLQCKYNNCMFIIAS